MLENPNESKNNQHFESAEKEARPSRISELIERRNLLASELKGLIEEEGTIIAARANDEASFERLIAINQRERELIDAQGEIERELSALWRRSQ